ncbi:MAG TPA: hypothetical protein VHJ77_10595 [Vicinamibacterales bacterium]|nr:hypothetical protein [Vicinamibacterales bacterium]
MGRRSSLFCGLIVLLADAGAAAMGGRVAELRADRGVVRAALELKDAFPANLRSALDDGATLHLRVEASLWEDRTWDRLVRPAVVAAFRLSKQKESRSVSIADVSGGLTTYPDYPDPLVIRVEVAPADRIQDMARYYVDAIVVLGTLADGELADAGTAVFGKDDGSVGLKSAGRFVLNTVLRITDYMQSVTTSIRSDRVSGREIKTR